MVLGYLGGRIGWFKGWFNDCKGAHLKTMISVTRKWKMNKGNDKER